MKIRKLHLLLLGGAMALGLAACGDSEESLAGPPLPMPSAGERVAFATARPILAAKCVSCHKDDNYTDSATLASGTGSFIAAIQSGAMPAPGSAALTDAEKATLLAWLNGLGPAAPAPKPITNAAGRVEFAAVLPITRVYCATCHGSYTDSARLSSSAASVQRVVEGGLMPAPPVTMTDVEKLTLVTWLKQEQGL
jgi:mono/diheme cytochrome c family protein